MVLTGFGVVGRYCGLIPLLMWKEFQVRLLNMKYCEPESGGGNCMRESGVLLPVASLPSAYGIGCFSKEAYAFVDWLKAAGQSYWQILPLGPTSYGDSPYQSFSTFAGNPYFIDLEDLIARGYLTREVCDSYDF